MPDFTLAGANVHWGVGYRQVKTRHSAYNLDAALGSFAADVLVLPEAFRPDALVDESITPPPDMFAALEARGYSVVSTPFMHFRGLEAHTPSVTTLRGHWELALASRFPILEWDAVPIGKVRNDPPGNRFAIHAQIDVHGTTVNVIALHTSSKLWYLGPVTHMRGLSAHLELTPGPAVIAGDFNCWGPGVRAVMRGWRQAVKGRTWPAHMPHSQIDHILVNESVEILDAEVLRPYGSDHLPVRAWLRV